ncbi:RNA recognition motif domain-containing protein [Phocaeicola oris]|uniref:RNA recognition motif domain-containing protein n=1 Tax=Phocaeicola oris TaxID=2896850 RepID=UPI00234F7354|nr:RNA-binding protein [Phocaeicola oris]MCE2616629.1 RNA-binding protein [Phocaeicola oris]
MNMYLGNLNYRVKEDDLEELLSAYGSVTSAKVVKDRETGRSKGFGFVEMEDAEAAAKAIAELNGTEFKGRQLVIKEALPKKA